MQLKNSSTYTSDHDSLKTSIVKVWDHKNLIWVFAKRDLQVKYAQTYLGLGWSIFKPLLGLFIYVFFFGFLMNWKTGNIPYAVYVLSGLVGWNLFTYIVSNGVTAANESTDLIKKIYFPKSILLLSKSLVGVVESLISLVLLIPFLVYYEVDLSWKIVFIPIVLFYNVVCGLVVTFIIASISIKKRDLLQVLPFLINMAIWFTPVFLSVQQFPQKVQFLFTINPIANVIDLWRWIFFDQINFQSIWLINAFIVLLLMTFAFYYYSSRENKLADHI
ncbi:MAG: ABC transporter permease [Vicingaceae bacterium]|jgi:lipopolysaccharide transport system permease protein